jgi:hypothetical protein
MKAEATAVETVYEYLAAKYDLDSEFTDTLPYDPTKTYGANNRVTIDFTAWVAGTQYVQGDCRINDGYGYQCLTDNNDAIFTPGNWLRLGLQYEIFYVPQPYPIFQLQLGQQVGSCVPGLYKAGDKAYWRGHTYTALQGTPVTSQNNIQYLTYADQPTANVFPDDPRQGNIYWLDNGAYTIEVNTPPGNEAWTKGDNRSQKIMMNVIDMALFWLHKRITPNNIPEVRFRAYDDVKKWLTQSKDALIKPSLTEKQPEQGKRIYGGSDTKEINSY